MLGGTPPGWEQEEDGLNCTILQDPVYICCENGWNLSGSAFLEEGLIAKGRLMRISVELAVPGMDLVGACPATGDRIFATGSDGVSKFVLRSCSCFWAPESPKQVAKIAVIASYLSPLFLLLGRDPCGDRILRFCLQKFW